MPQGKDTRMERAWLQGFAYGYAIDTAGGSSHGRLMPGEHLGTLCDDPAGPCHFVASHHRLTR